MSHVRKYPDVLRANDEEVDVEEEQVADLEITRLVARSLVARSQEPGGRK